MYHITAIPAFNDNYIWAIHNGTLAVVVDPGDAAPVLAFLQQHRLRLSAILCTHRHNDHIGGIEKLRGVYNVPVYGRRHPDNPHITHELHEGQRCTLTEFALGFDIMELPGHLDDHIAYYHPDMLFCGDILFGAGCGRNKEGTLAQLHHSLQRLSHLPDDTPVYCAHEYTAANIRFALVCEPGNAALQRRALETQRLRASNLPTLPSNIGLERATNPFLRCDQPEIIATLRARGLLDTSGLAVFSALRAWRSQF